MTIDAFVLGVIGTVTGIASLILSIILACREYCQPIGFEWHVSPLINFEELPDPDLGALLVRLHNKGKTRFYLADGRYMAVTKKHGTLFIHRTPLFGDKSYIEPSNSGLIVLDLAMLKALIVYRPEINTKRIYLKLTSGRGRVLKKKVPNEITKQIFTQISIGDPSSDHG